MQRLANLLTRFRRDERGVFMVIFAILAMVLIATSGAVVDFTKVQQARTRAQTALDSATLALQGQVGKTGVTADTLKTKAQTILNERLNDASITATVISATPDVTAGKLNIQAYIQVPTAFVQLVGITSIRSNLQSEVTRASSDLEVSVSLDITGSMQATYDKKGHQTSNKIGDLITATNSLIDLLVATTQTPTYSKMAIVPWSAGVNVGSTYATSVRGTPTATTKKITAAAWKSGSTFSITGITKANPAVITTSSNHGFVTGDTVYLDDIDGMDSYWYGDLNDQAFVITKVSDKKFSIPVNTSTWNSYDDDGEATKCLYAGCPMMVTSNGHGFANGAALYVSNASWLGQHGYFADNVTANTLTLTGSFGPDEGSYSSGAKLQCADYGCAYRTFYAVDGSIQSFAVSTCVSERTTNAYTDASPSTTLLGMNYPPSGQCTDQVIKPLTSDRTALHSLANSLEAGGSTAGHLGLAWGWYMISPNFASLWPVASRPKAYGSANLIKAVVFMTDGVFNTPYCSGVVASDGLSGSGGNSDHINCAATNGSSKDQAQAICDKIKEPANKTLLYVVGFDLAGDTTSLDFLRGCATSVDYFFQADNGADLTSAFRAIAQSLSELRISK